MNILDADYSGDTQALETLNDWKEGLSDSADLLRKDESFFKISPELASLLWSLDHKRGSWIGRVRYWRHQFLQTSKTNQYLNKPSELNEAFEDIFTAFECSYPLDEIRGRESWIKNILGIETQYSSPPDDIKKAREKLKQLQKVWNKSETTSTMRESMYQSLISRATLLIHASYDQLLINLKK